MKQIYTRTGDEGMTSLRGGVRVPKDDPHIEANGCLDELNALLGVARALLPAEAQEINELLWAVQRELMVVMSHVATPAGQVNPKPLRLLRPSCNRHLPACNRLEQRNRQNKRSIASQPRSPLASSCPKARSW